jgi:hypothetical protein
VPSPFFLQELLLGPYEVSFDDLEYSASNLKIFSGSEVSLQERVFYEHFIGDRRNWWLTAPEVGFLPPFDDLSGIFREELDIVSIRQ